MAARRKHLAERRRAVGFSQETLAHELDVDRTTVGRWERGEIGPAPYIQPRLGKLLRIPPDAMRDLLTAEPAARETPKPPAHPEAAGPATGRNMYRRELMGC
jgi:DNA-binding XRE family transcriptional regulator